MEMDTSLVVIYSQDGIHSSSSPLNEILSLKIVSTMNEHWTDHNTDYWFYQREVPGPRGDDGCISWGCGGALTIGILIFAIWFIFFFHF
jgi:hypothetical protein